MVEVFVSGSQLLQILQKTPPGGFGKPASLRLYGVSIAAILIFHGKNPAGDCAVNPFHRAGNYGGQGISASGGFKSNPAKQGQSTGKGEIAAFYGV